MATELIVVHTTDDAMQAEMLAEVLAAEGIRVEVVGPRSAALLGVASHIVPLLLRVPEERAAEARELIAALVADHESQQPPEASNAKRAEPTRRRRRDRLRAAERAPRRRVVAVGAALFVPGGSHYYANQPWSGLVLTATFVATLGYLMLGDGSPERVSTGAVALAALVMLDMVGGLRALRRAQRGGSTHAPRLRQLAAGVGLAAVALGLGTVVGPRLPPPERRPSSADLELLRLLQEQQREQQRRAASGDGSTGPLRLFDPRCLPPAAPASSSPGAVGDCCVP